MRPWEQGACLPARAEISFDCSLSLLNQGRGRLGLLCERWPCCACRFHCRLMGDLAAQSSGKVGLVVGVELRVLAPSPTSKTVEVDWIRSSAPSGPSKLGDCDSTKARMKGAER